MDKIRDQRVKEKFFIDDEYLNGYAKLCGSHATLVYISLCRHADKDQKCFPSKKLIAEELAISERSVYNGIISLQEWNIIKFEQSKKSDGTFKNNTYVLLDKTEWKSKPQATGADGSPQARDDIRLSSHRRHVVPNKDTHTNKDTHIASSSAVRTLTKHFYDTYEKRLGSKPAIGGSGGNLLKQRLKEYGESKVRFLIDFFISHPKAREHPSLSAALSAHTVALWEINNNNKKDLYA